MPRTEEEPGSREKSRWRIPPPLLRDPAVPGPAGIAVVQEIPSPLGTLLWTLLRGVQLRFAGTGRGSGEGGAGGAGGESGAVGESGAGGERAAGGEGVAGRGSAEPQEPFPLELVERRAAELEAVLAENGGELERPLRILVRALGPGAGGRAPARGQAPAADQVPGSGDQAPAPGPAAPGQEQVARTLERIAAWAAREGHARTAIECLQTAALVHPAEARYPLQVAAAVLDLGQPGRAESWLQRAIGVARRRSDWGPYVEAYHMHGKLMLERGALPAARTSLMKALRRSVRQGNRVQEASVRSAFFRLERREGNHEAAAEQGSAALGAFGADHPALPGFALDVARALAAIRAWDDLLALLPETTVRLPEAERAEALGLQARAAGEKGDARLFRRAQQGLDRLWTAPGSAAPWADATRGAVALGDPQRSRRLARRTEAMARRMGESLERYSAEPLLREIEDERSTAAEAGLPEGEALRRLRALRAIAEPLERLLRIAPRRVEHPVSRRAGGA